MKELTSIVMLLVLLSGCVQETQIANPASEYCAEQGFESEIRTGESGGQYGVCMFPDGTECLEWAYYRGECEPGQIEEVECAVPADCEGKMHIMCVGEWECQTGRCAWICETPQENKTS